MRQTGGESCGAKRFVMNPNIRLRVVVFFATIMLLVALIAWTAHTAWQRMAELQAHLSAQQWKSLDIGDTLQENILNLDNLILRYAAYRDDADWTNFDENSREFKNRWINKQQPLSSSPEEQTLLRQIHDVYSNYLAAASVIHKRIYGTHVTLFRLVEFADFQKQSTQILNLGSQLARARQNSLDSFQQQTAHSLDILRSTLLGALVLLLAASAWLAAMVYRDLIAPLKVQLVESRQLLERQEKLASLGMLAAGVAHEIRNPLTAIKAWLYLQQKRLKSGTPEYEDAHLIAGEINRLERIVREFLQFARPPEPQFAVVSAEQTLREAQKLMAPGLEKNQITLALDGVAPALIRVDPEQIKQVLINLIQNAADSIGKNGAISLRAHLDEKRLCDRPTPVVVLEVSDSGKGIPPEAEKRLFDPFFTTKDSGTGLGLPIAARLVEKHQGALQYQNQPGRGATFGIILPRVES
jgi:signal transduction histidine kinase